MVWCGVVCGVAAGLVVGVEEVWGGRSGVGSGLGPLDVGVMWLSHVGCNDSEAGDVVRACAFVEKRREGVWSVIVGRLDLSSICVRKVVRIAPGSL